MRRPKRAPHRAPNWVNSLKSGKNVEKLRKKTSGKGYTSTIAKPPVLRRQLYLWLVLVLMALTVMLTDTRIGLSLLWGFSVCLLPAACFSWYATQYRGARAAVAMVSGFYRAEAVKFALTIFLFALVFQRADQINPVAFFLAFVAAQIFTWVLVAITLRKSSR